MVEDEKATVEDEKAAKKAALKTSRSRDKGEDDHTRPQRLLRDPKILEPGSSDHSNMASDNTDMASDNTNEVGRDSGTISNEKMMEYFNRKRTPPHSQVIETHRIKKKPKATYVLGSGMGWPATSPVSPDSKSDDSESEEDEFLASFRRGDHKKMVQVKDTVYVPGPQSSGCDQQKFEKDHAAQRVEALQATVAALQAERDLKRKRV